MSNLIALGYGWHELEGDYRWTTDKFSINVLNKDIDSIFLSIRCNKIFADYSMVFSLNDWKTSGKINLSDGLNMVNIQLNSNTTEIKFKCSSFIPSNIGASNDNRVLGIQISKFTLKSGNNIKEIPIHAILPKSELWADVDYVMDDTINFVTLKSGWHELEENRQRWTNGNAELLINTDKYKVMKLCIHANKNQVLRVVLNDFEEKVEKLFTGLNEIFVDIVGIKKINLMSEPFSPKNIEPYSKDSRQLGIKLTAISIIGDINTKEMPIKNIFFNHDIPQLTNFIKKYDFKSPNIKSIGGFGDIILNKFDDVNSGKLNLNDQIVFFSHRSGWSYVVNALLKHHNKDGVKFEGFLERPFIWNRKSLIDCGELPFKHPWVGVLHNPWTFPIENYEFVTSEDLVKSTIFQKSLETCKGLYVLSKDLLKRVKKEVSVPVNFLYHPTEFVQKTFSMKEFKENGEKKILEVGSWLRKVNSLFLLNSDRKIWNKVRIVPVLLNFEKMMNRIKSEREKYKLNVTREMQESVKNIPPLSDDEYDDFLTRNIVFTDLYASSANNVIIECIVRGTPILVNPIPAIVEYLGKDYPFYFNSIDEASEKVNDLSLIEKTNEYLMNCSTREFLTKEYFLQSFENSDIYKSL